MVLKCFTVFLDWFIQQFFQVLINEFYNLVCMNLTLLHNPGRLTLASCWNAAFATIAPILKVCYQTPGELVSLSSCLIVLFSVSLTLVLYITSVFLIIIPLFEIIIQIHQFPFSFLPSYSFMHSFLSFKFIVT